MALWKSAKFSSGENEGSIQFFPGGDGFGTKLGVQSHSGSKRLDPMERAWISALRRVRAALHRSP